MKQHPVHNRRVLAIDPTTKGFGFAVLERQQELIGYGVKTVIGDKNSASLKKIAELLEYYQPEVMVLENPTGKGSRRCLRVQQLIEGTVKLAASKRIKSRRFSRAQMRQVFASLGAATKYQIAVEITKRFPELELRLPPIRKPWMSEDERMS